MRATSILSEVWRNVVSGTARVPLFAALIGVIAGLGAAAEIATVHGLHSDARAYIDGGGATQYIVAEGSIGTPSCEALTTYQNVEAAGALRPTAEVKIDALPGTTFEAYEVTSGFGALLGIDSHRDGVWISQDLAESLGLHEGSTVPSEDRQLRVAGVFEYPNDGRDTRLSHAILVPVPVGAEAFDECWMRSWPQSPDGEGILRSALASAEGSEVAISQLNKSLAAQFDGPVSFVERLTRWVPLVTVSGGFLAGLAWTRRRKLEYASALHAGQSRAALTAGAVLETLVWALLGTMLAGVAAWSTALALMPEEIDWAPTLLIPPLLSAATGPVIGALCGAFLVRESDLFRYFKDR